MRAPVPEQLAAVLNVIEHAAPDILLLSGIDYDAGLHAVSEFQRHLAARGVALPHRFSASPNWGLPTRLDLDGDGRFGEPEDAQAFGNFKGAGGMVLLSRFPILEDDAEVFAEFLWVDFPAANLPFARGSPEALALRLSASGHWVVPVRLPNRTVVHVLALHASPPVFDGPEDRNGKRNADQVRFWVDYLNGWHPTQSDFTPPALPIIVGTLNADPEDGEARRDPIQRLLKHNSLQDTRPSSIGAARASALQKGVNATHRGPAATDTVDWPESGATSPGNLRVDYILPSKQLEVTGSGVDWPEDTQSPGSALVASRHRLVWVDFRQPPAP